jgi:hypothetical protein
MVPLNLGWKARTLKELALMCPARSFFGHEIGVKRRA